MFGLTHVLTTIIKNHTKLIDWINA